MRVFPEKHPLANTSESTAGGQAVTTVDLKGGIHHGSGDKTLIVFKKYICL
jgi:hypothetical protein